MKIKNILLGFFLFAVLSTMICTNVNSAVNKNENINLTELGKLAILDEGRIKPIETYARTILLQFSGKRTFERQPAVNWLAKLIFTPWMANDDKVFLINSPEIPQAINLTPEKHRRYNFTQLQSGLMKLRELAIAADAIEAKQRSLVEHEILRVYNNLSLYIKLRNSFTFAIAHDDFLIEDPAIITALGFPNNKTSFSFLDIALKANQLNEETRSLETKKSEQWSREEKDFMRLLRNLYQWSSSASQKDNGMTIMPLSAEQETWLSPWEMFLHNFGDPEIQQQLILIQKMSDAYFNHTQLDFDISAKAFNMATTKKLSLKQAKSYRKIPLEIIYNHSNFFRFAWICYLFAFFTFLFSLIWTRPLFHTFGFGFLILGLIPHLIAMVMRINIMSRPPVTNLYETFIFVGVVCVILSILTELFNKNWLGIVVGSICGFAALTIADKFSAEGDTMRMLVAVLDSNFWLSTHVLTITIGYAGCSVAAIMGHVYIVQALFIKNRPEQLKTTYRYILGILGFGLATAFLGTMLGGIWADQSWGRFWGWDPKENGALLIVLWSAIIFHAKLGRLINPLGVAVGAALGLIVVMWAWFGVNLLSIGLHSYGFTSGLATSLGLYLGCELLFIFVSVILLGKRGIPI